MQVTETLSEGLKRGFTVVVPSEDIETRRTARLTDLSKTLRLPGFRPGKVPLPIVRQRYGTAVTAEVLEESVSQATEALLAERKMRPAQTPKIDLISNVDPSAGTANDLEFKVELELLPDIALPDFGQISLTRRKAEVPPEAIDQELTALVARNRELVPITPEELAARTGNASAPTGSDASTGPDASTGADAPTGSDASTGSDAATGPGAAIGEVLTIDFVGKIDGEPFPNGAGTDIDVELGGTGFIPGFAEQLVGLAPGGTRTIEVTFPEDYGNTDLAGKAATFDITAKKLSKPVVPTVEEMATKLAFDDVDGLRRFISGRILREYDQLSRVRIKRDLLDALAGLISFDAPQGIVDTEFEQIWQRLEAERKAGRLDEDDKAKDETLLRAEYRAIAERRVKLGLVLAEIGRVNGIMVAPEELSRAKRAEASRYPGQEVQMMEFFRKYPKAEDALRGPIFEEKVIDFILELATVTDQVVTPEELAQEPPVALPGFFSSPDTAPDAAAAAESVAAAPASDAPPAAEAATATEAAPPTEGAPATDSASATEAAHAANPAQEGSE